MKKYFAIFGAAILVVALASTVAMAQFKAFGHMEIESYWSNNMIYLDNRASDNRQAVAERFRLHFTYGDPKTVQAYVMFEADSTAWGEAGPGAYGSTMGTAGTQNSNGIQNGGATGQPMLVGRNHIGSYQTDTTGLEVTWAFLDFTIPNTPLTAKVGIQRFVIGGDIGRFWMGNDAPGIMATANFAPHAIQAFWWKENKQNALKDNDNDMYGVRYLLKQQMFSVEAWFAYQNDRRSQTEVTSLVPSPTPSATSGAAAGTTTYSIQQIITDRAYEVKPWWIGLNVPMTFGNLKIDPIFIYEGGKARSYTGTGTDVDIDAYLFDVNASYRLGPGLSFGLEGFYTTGTDSSKPTKQNRFAWATNSEGRSVFGNGKSVFMFSNTELTYYGYKQLDPGGLWYARANVEYSPLSWLNLGANYFYIGNTGTGTTNPVGGRTDQAKAYAGSEINLITTLKIYENFIYKIGMGLFLPGDCYTTPATSTVAERTADTAWNILTNLRYNF